MVDIQQKALGVAGGNVEPEKVLPNPVRFDDLMDVFFNYTSNLMFVNDLRSSTVMVESVLIYILFLPSIGSCSRLLITIILMCSALSDCLASWPAHSPLSQQNENCCLLLAFMFAFEMLVFIIFRHFVRKEAVFGSTILHTSYSATILREHIQDFRRIHIVWHLYGKESVCIR